MKALNLRLARDLRATLPQVALAVGLSFAAVAPAFAAEVAREQRPVSGVDRVVLRAIGNLDITQGDSESLVVEAEARLLPQIRTEVKNRTLTIDITGREFRTREPVRYLLRVRQLSGIEGAGSGNVNVAPLVAQRLQLTLSGSGSVRMAALTADVLAVDLPGSGDVAIEGGRVGLQEIRIDGAAQYVAPALQARDARVEIGGSGDVTLAAEKTLTGTIRGSGRIAYRGDPVVTQTIEGAGSIERDLSIGRK